MEKKIVKDIGKRKFLRSSKSNLFIINEAKPAFTCTYLILKNCFEFLNFMLKIKILIFIFLRPSTPYWNGYFYTFFIKIGQFNIHYLLIHYVKTNFRFLKV